MAAQVVVLFFLCCTSLFLAARILSPQDNHTIMAQSVDKQPSLKEDLSIRCSFDAPSRTLTVTLENTSPDKTYTLLTWDTPLDPQALNLGALTLEDVDTGAAVEGPRLKINRKLPPSRDAFVQVLPEQSSSKTLNIDLPWIPRDGRTVRFRAQGSWKAVWAKPLAEVTDQEVGELTGDVHLEGAIRDTSDGNAITRLDRV
jgi:hypothetical protein